MDIDQSIAREIAEQLSETIGQKINMMNTDGVIIASSDYSRIGQVHGGARKIIEDGLPYLIVEDDTQFEGSKNGVNLPIVFENEVVGVIGITGPVARVFQYGNIIKRMTEILLLDSKAKEQLVIEQKARERFYDEWILGKLEEKNPVEFERMAASLAIDTNRPVRIAVLSLGSDSAFSDTVLTDISRQIRHFISTRLNGSAFRTVTKLVCILQCTDEAFIIESLLELFSSLKKTYSCDIFAGIDSNESVLHLNESYTYALKAMEIARKRGVPLLSYDPFDLEFMIEGLTKESKDRFIRALFPGVSEEEIEDYLSFARIYLEEDGSLIAISNRLFVHKNTIKYKINRLTEVTGVDIRTCRGIYLFTLATN